MLLALLTVGEPLPIVKITFLPLYFTFEIVPLTLTSYDVKHGESLAVVDAAMVDKFTADSSWNTAYDDFTKYFCKLQNNRYIYTQCAECLQRARQEMADNPDDIKTADFLIQKKREMDKNTNNFRNFLYGYAGFELWFSVLQKEIDKLSATPEVEYCNAKISALQNAIKRAKDIIQECKDAAVDAGYCL